ncbi:hypothetical protein [Cupriavidus sp. CP313]
MEKNPAAVTERFTVKVIRRRLTLDEFKAILAKAPEVSEWLENAMLLALVSGQDRSTVARWERSTVKGDVIIARRSKTDVKVAIPTALRLDAIGMSLADVIAKCKSTHIVSKYLIHHIRPVGSVSRGDAVGLTSMQGKHRGHMPHRWRRTDPLRTYPEASVLLFRGAEYSAAFLDGASKPMQQSMKTNDRAGILPTPRHRVATPPSTPTRPVPRLAGRPARRIAQEINHAAPATRICAPAP